MSPRLSSSVPRRGLCDFLASASIALAIECAFAATGLIWIVFKYTILH